MSDRDRLERLIGIAGMLSLRRAPYRLTTICVTLRLDGGSLFLGLHKIGANRRLVGPTPDSRQFGGCCASRGSLGCCGPAEITYLEVIRQSSRPRDLPSP